MPIGRSSYSASNDSDDWYAVPADACAETDATPRPREPTDRLEQSPMLARAERLRNVLLHGLRADHGRGTPGVFLLRARQERADTGGLPAQNGGNPRRRAECGSGGGGDGGDRGTELYMHREGEERNGKRTTDERT
ncbi:hypothetical protein B0H10DRAFT_2217016 [Mycena sp. CBHHK59/15]|nr:hypothetical protein B0H10DRAFT_2217016 [Mycena sp. CBHHK59/15]